jgi:ribosome maturation factor RimP
MTLPIFLLHLVDKKITIMLLEKEEQGTVHEVDKESLTIFTAEKEMKIIPYHSIYFIIT